MIFLPLAIMLYWVGREMFQSYRDHKLRERAFKAGYDTGVKHSKQVAQTFYNHRGNLQGTFIHTEINSDTWKTIS